MVLRNITIQNGKIDQALAVLKEREEIFEEDGATWFRSMTYGDDKNRVLIKTTVLTHT